MEDDRLLGETIEELLTNDGYSVEWVKNGQDAAERTYESSYSLYIFDINVPEINGFELLEDLRNASDVTPTIFISALVDLESISKGFKLGADDYIKKPFFPEELLIRVNAKVKKYDTSIVVGDITYDANSKVLRRDGELIVLGEVQLDLFDMLVSHRNQIVDRTILLECLEHPSSVGLRVAITKLKQTLDLNIKNVRGVGYILEKS